MQYDYLEALVKDLSLYKIKTEINMKNLRIWQTLSLFILLLSITLPLSARSDLLTKLNTITLIIRTQSLETSLFAEKYLLRFKQPLDHSHPEKGSFSQRVIVAHVGYDRPTLMVTEGYGAARSLNPGYYEELSKLFNTNIIAVEHRYFLESTPKPKDWKYLTAWNSARDLHAIREAFRSIYPGKWIATGISKGGQTAMLYRTYFPDDIDITVPYVAPLCRSVEDGRHEPFLRTVAMPDDRQKVEDFQMEVLRRKAALLPHFKKYCSVRKLQFRAPVEDIYDYTVLEYSFSLWQWGIPVSRIPSVSASDKELFDHLVAISAPSYFVKEGSNTSFFVQAARELGYYGYDIRPFREYLSIGTSKDYLRRLMIPEELADMEFDETLSYKITRFLKENDPKMIFIYGQYDPWTAAGVTWLKGKKNIHVFVQPKGSHMARIHTLPQKEKEEAIGLIKKWLEE